jgi:hypothetical protein
MLRTPLDPSSGTWEATTARYDATILASARPGPTTPAAERLAVYNRQYWFRLFGVLQSEHPLTTAVVGAWSFNALATGFLLAQPPRGKDLGDVAIGFAEHLEATLPPGPLRLSPSTRTVPRAAVVQAASIDAAFRSVFIAPPEPVLRLSPAEAASLHAARLQPSAAFRMIEEAWPLVALRRELGSRTSTSPCSLPEPHPHGAQRWAVCRAPGGERVLALEPVQARLLQLLCEHPVGRALAILEAEHAAVDAGALARDVQRWLAQSMSLGLWRGLAREGA